MSDTAIAISTPLDPERGQPAKQRKGTAAQAVTEPATNGRPRNRRKSAADQLRYFVGVPAMGREAPHLEQEMESEAEGLVLAFKSDRSLYLVSEYSVIQHIDGGRVTLEKELVTP
jgi:hypothetical protein